MNLPGKIETASNIATIGVAVLLSAVLVKVYLVPQSSPARTAPPARAGVAVGTNLKGQLPGIDWSKNGRTLVLAMSTTCHYCRESEPFYRRIKQEVGNKVKIVAALPQPLPDAEQYLNGAGLRVDQLKSVPLTAIGVSGTPTILLVNAKGVVTKVWVGRLGEQQQEQVLNLLKEG
jgi:hypothetical protein